MQFALCAGIKPVTLLVLLILFSIYLFKKEQMSEKNLERTQSEDPTVQCSVTDLLTTAVKVKVTLLTYLM